MDITTIFGLLTGIFLICTFTLGILVHHGKPVFKYHLTCATITLLCAIAYFVLKI